LGSVSSLVSEKKIFEISANQSILLALADIDLCFLCQSEIQDGHHAIHRLTLDPMGKCSNAFFSETTNIIKAKLYMNVHWMVT
jgi:hypothetical protein